MGKHFKQEVNEFLISEVYNRFARGGFIIGDAVVLKKGFEKMPEFKALPENIKAAFLKMAQSSDYADKYMRVTNLMPVNPPVNSVAGANASINGVDLEVTYEMVPGLLNNVPFVLPSAIFELEAQSADGYSTPKVPDSLIYKGQGDGKAKEVGPVAVTMTPTEPVQPTAKSL